MSTARHIPTAETYEAIARLNNEAVRLIHSTDFRGFKAAVNLLRSAAKSIRAAGSPTGDDNDRRVTHSLEQARALGTTNDDDDNMARADETLGLLAKDPLNTGEAFLEAIRLVPSPGGVYSNDPLVNVSVISAVVIFNLAMAHQRVASTSTEPQHELFPMNDFCCDDATISDAQATLLHKAQSFYHKIERILQGFAGCPMNPQGEAVFHFIAMAALNNLGQNAFLLADFDESRRFFADLTRLACTLEPHSGYHRYGLEAANLLVVVKMKCLVNATMVPLPVVSPAA